MSAPVPSPAAPSVAPRPHRPHNAMYVFGISMIAAMGGLMFGFDIGIISGVIPYIKQQFVLGNFALGLVTGVFELGCMFGAFGISRYADKYGRRRTMHLNAVLLVISSVCIPFCFGAIDLSLWRFVQGLSVGAASVLSPMYIAEISPAESRGRYVSLNQMSIIMGFLLAAICGWLFGNADTGSQAWRWMLGSAMAPAGLFFLLLFLVPETPRWLVKAGRDEEAKGVLDRIGGASHLDEIKASLAATHRHGQYRDLLAPGLCMALMLGVGLAALQQLCGIHNVCTYIQVIFEKAKIELSDGLFKNVYIALVFFVFTFVAIATIDRIGRRMLMLIGTGLMGVTLFGLAWTFHLLAQKEAVLQLAAGVAEKAALNQDIKSIGWLVFVLIMVYIATFAFTLGPVTWVLLSEIYPNFIREKAFSIASCTLWTSTFLVILATPYLLHFPVFNFILFGCFNVVGFFAVLKWLPETNGLTLEEMEGLWAKKAGK